MAVKIGVIGSRTITSHAPVSRAIVLSPWYNTDDEITIISGGADGVDSSAERFAEVKGLNLDVIDPDWSDWSNGHPAKERNTQIIEKSDAVVAVWDGKSPGTRDSIDKALDRGVPIYVEVP